jgi:hypothetical protein
MRSEQKIIEYESVKDAVDYLNDKCWHDSVLYEIVLLRTDSADRVVLKFDLLLDWDQQVSEYIEIVFNGCYHVAAQMNWGVDCMSDGEMVLNVECTDSDDLIDAIREKWGANGTDIGIFRMKMASTSSTLEIVFRGVTVKQTGGARPHNAPPPLYPQGSR